MKKSALILGTSLAIISAQAPTTVGKITGPTSPFRDGNWVTVTGSIVGSDTGTTLTDSTGTIAVEIGTLVITPDQPVTLVGEIDQFAHSGGSTVELDVAQVSQNDSIIWQKTYSTTPISAVIDHKRKQRITASGIFIGSGITLIGTGIGFGIAADRAYKSGEFLNKLDGDIKSATSIGLCIDGIAALVVGAILKGRSDRLKESIPAISLTPQSGGASLAVSGSF